MAKPREWNPAQELAIEARGGTLVVSAAAGSGKTAVLVERCIRRLTDTEHLCDADRLLIVTFTRAATAEIRSRLSDAVAERLKQDPHNEHLQKQQMLLPSAQICTIDSFCANLVREHFEQLGLSPDFRLLDETEVGVLQQAAMGQVVEELYAEQDPVFRQLVELLATGRDDASLEENILRLHTFSRAYPSPQRWLEESLALYDDPTPAFRIVRQSLFDLLESWKGRWNTVLAALESEQPIDGITFDGTVDCIHGYLDLLDELEELLQNEQWDAFREAVEDLDIPTLRKPSVPKDLKDLFSSPALELAKQWKSSFTNAKLKAAFGAFHLQGPDEARADHAQLRPLAEKLTEAVLRFDTLYAVLKREENALDFADTELFALELLVEDPGAEPVVPTELALALREQYEEILIDEYQDTNKLQDTVFASISKDDLFMVGDVKQSIYRFRQAMPELFLEKKDAYPVCEAMPSSYPATVILGKNYRSRKGILDTVNYTFTRLMSREVGEISYDESEKLRFGAEDRYPDRDEPDVELHIVVPDAEQDKRVAEAAHIARFIAEEIARSKETDTPLSYRDFAILLRSAKPAGNVFRKVLTEAGIPAYAEQGAGFLEAPEVMTMVSLLEVIDNPVQDVPLLAVLLSPVFGFSEEEVAALRVASRRETIYKALLAAEERGDTHVASTLELLRRFRTLAVSMGAGELLRKVYEETSYPALAGAMLAGDQRTANLRLLLQYADSYDDNSSYGLAGFVRYLGRLREQGGALTTAATLSPNADVVQIMSIHKSKGLEFKVCILADLKHQFNDRDLNRSVILHPELGIGLRGRQPDTGFTYPTLAHTALKEATLRSARSEELRVLYVAMTRAKEKLILSACDAPTKKQTTDPLTSSLVSAADRLYGDAVVPPYEVLHARTFYQWLLMALLPHPSGAPLRALLGETADLLPSVPDDSDIAPVNVILDRTEAAEDLPASEPETQEPADETQVAALQERMDYEYPYADLSRTLSKRSASHLAEKPFSTEYFAESRPESLSKQGMTPAERGTCLHKFMQFADPDAAAADPDAEKQRLVDRGFLLPDEAEVVDTARVRAFFASDLAARMKKSPRVLREQKFAILLPAGRFDEALSGSAAEEEVLIQGIIDSAFEEDGQLVLLDYKTDRVRDEEDLRSRYREQLELYRIALEETLGLPVKEVCLYSFHLGRTISL